MALRKERTGIWRCFFFLRRRENGSTQEKNLSEQGQEPAANSTHMLLYTIYLHIQPILLLLRRVREWNPGHIGGRRVLSQRRRKFPFRIRSLPFLRH